MNDRFKFRVWDKNHNAYISSQMIGTLVYFGYRDEFHIEFKCFSTFADSLIIEQCTGLKDKNGKLIYEGDYIKDWRGDVYKVVWLDEYAQFFCENINDATDGYHFDESIHDMCICGNIHEQAEQKGK